MVRLQRVERVEERMTSAAACEPLNLEMRLKSNPHSPSDVALPIHVAAKQLNRHC